MYKLISGVSTEPISYAQALDQIRLDEDSTTETTLIQAKIEAAREYGEDYTSHAFAPQTWVLYLQDFPNVDTIPWEKGPLTSITSVKYKDSDGTEHTMTEGTDYFVDKDTFPGAVFLPKNKSWPTFNAYPYNAVAITGVCGYTGVEPYVIPNNFKQAMLLHVGLMFRYRDEEIPDAAMRTVNRLYDLRGVAKV